MVIKRFLTLGILFCLFLGNFLFSHYCHVTFQLGDMSRDEFITVVNGLAVDYVSPQYLNEGYASNDQGSKTYYITLRGWDIRKLWGKGYPISSIACSPPWD